MLPGYPFYAPECVFNAPECFFNAWKRHFDARRLHLALVFFGLRRFFRSRMRLFVQINWKDAILTIASYASRSEDFGSLNIVQKRWEKVEFQAVQHILRWLFEFWSASAFCLQILLHLAPAPFFHFWIVFSVEISSMFQQAFWPKFMFFIFNH